MDISLKERLPVECSKCGKTFDAEIWVIIDGNARPDLISRVCDGKWDKVTCPKCHDVHVDLPLLIYIEDAGHWSCFTTTEMYGGNRAERASAHGERLYEMMQTRLGGRVDPIHLALNHHAMPFEMLKQYLKGDTKAIALADAVSQAARENVLGKKVSRG